MVRECGHPGRLDISRTLNRGTLERGQAWFVEMQRLLAFKREDFQAIGRVLPQRQPDLRPCEIRAFVRAKRAGAEFGVFFPNSAGALGAVNVNLPHS